MKAILIEFGLPAMILIICFVLLLTGIDGEVKGIFAMSCGWLIKSGVDEATRLKSESFKGMTR